MSAYDTGRVRGYPASPSSMYVKVEYALDRWYNHAVRHDAWFMCWLDYDAATFRPEINYPHAYGVMDDFGTLVYVETCI